MSAPDELSGQDHYKPEMVEAAIKDFLHKLPLRVALGERMTDLEMAGCEFLKLIAEHSCHIPNRT